MYIAMNRFKIVIEKEKIVKMGGKIEKHIEKMYLDLKSLIELKGKKKKIILFMHHTVFGIQKMIFLSGQKLRHLG